MVNLLIFFTNQLSQRTLPLLLQKIQTLEYKWLTLINDNAKKPKGYKGNHG